MSGAAVREKREILPLEHFKMLLYADGKVLALQPTDEIYKGYLSAIRAQTEDEDIDISFLLLHYARVLAHLELAPFR